MKAMPSTNPSEQKLTTARRGSAFASALVVSSILSVMAGGYLGYLNHEYYINYRSYNWTRAMHLMEAGIEEGLFEMNYRYLKGYGFWWINGWRWIDNDDYKPLITLPAGHWGYTRNITNFRNTDGTVVGDYKIQIINPDGNEPYALAKGTVTNSPYGKNVARMCKVSIYRRPLFTLGFFSDQQIDMNGNNIYIDSYISSDPLYSTNGQYDVNKRRDRGDVGTNLGIVNSIAVGNADVYGQVATGPGGSITIGTQGRVGPFGTAAGVIADGYFRDDMQVDMPQMSLPSNFNVFSPNLGTINSSTTITSGDWIINAINCSGQDVVTINGNARLWVKGGIDMTGQSIIRTIGNSQVQMYIGGTSFRFAGNSLDNGSKLPANFQMYCFDSVTSANIVGNGSYNGVFYARNANITFNGNGHASGSVVGKRITMTGNSSFHYDETLAMLGPTTGYRARSWEEIDTTP